MVKSAILSAIALFLVLATVSAERMNRPYDCSGASPVETLSQFATGTCSSITNVDDDEWNKFKDSLELEDRLDVVERCTCNLLRHELAWKSMVTHELNTIYLATRRLVDQVYSEKKKQFEEKKTNVPTKELLAELGDDDGHIFYWDNLKNILVEVTDDQKGSTRVAEAFMEHYSQVYYDTESYTKPYTGSSMGMQKQVSLTCSRHLQNFDTFLFYFDRLKALSGNDRFVLEVVGYNYDLYRLFTGLRLCNFLDTAGYIGWKVDD